jgi:hypothetical protein
MRELFILVAHLLVTLAKLARPGSLGAVAAESLAVKQQFAHHEASAAPCSETDFMGSAGAGSLCAFVSPKRLSKMAVILQASTLLRFHQAW